VTNKTVYLRVYLCLIVIFVGIMVCFGVSIYQNTAQTMKKQLGDKCIGIASVVSVLIEEDIDGFIAFSQTLDVDSAYYQQIWPKLNRIRYENDSHIAFLYVEVRVSDTDMMYILDGEYPDDPLFSPPGYIDALTPSELEAYRTHAPVVPDVFVSNDYGTLLTCYAPLHHPGTGAFLGLVGVDVSIDQYNAVMRNQLISIVLSIALLIVLLGLALLLSSARVEGLIARDNLTGVYNKAHFMHILRQQLAYAKRKGVPTTVFMADLDHFKHVNDTYGHVFGDVVLSAVAGTIGKQLRKMDCLARYGGEEFAAFLPDIGVPAAQGVVERIRQAVENLRIPNAEHGVDVQITISIGLAHVAQHRSAQETLALADQALYVAKRTRNTAATYAEDYPE